MHAYFHLFLGRDTVEAAATGIALDVHDTEAVTSIFADTLESCKCAFVYLGLKGFGLISQGVFFLARLGYNLGQFGLFLGKWDYSSYSHLLLP